MPHPIEHEEMRLVADLLTNPGYHILLSALQSEIDFAADQMDNTDTYDADIRNKALWRSLRRVFVILRDKPQELKDELDRELAKPRTRMEEFMATGPNSYGKYLQALAAHSTALENQPDDQIS